MRYARFIIVILALSLVASVLLAGQVHVRWGGRSVQVPRTADGRLELLPVLHLLGADAGFSHSAGTWGVVLGDHQVQFTPGSRWVLMDGELKKLDEAPVSTPSGVAASERFLEQAILEPFGFHLEHEPGGLRIAEGAAYLSPILVVPVAADFGSTTTVVLTLGRKERVEVEDRDGAVVVHFPEAEPQLDESRRVASARITSIGVHGRDLVIRLSEGAGLLGSHVLDDPPRVSLDLGPKARPAPASASPPQLRATVHPIVLDPGHGGGDTGARSPSGLEEKTLVLAIARRVARILRGRGFPTRLTREGDTGRALADRTAFANRLEARVFVSLHANASRFSSARGAETYYMSLKDEATDEHAAATARLENASGERSGGHDGLDLILWQMAQAEVLNESSRLALAIQRRLNGLEGVPDRGVKQAPFVVLTGATMPAVLVEVGFLSNPTEARRLATAEYQEQLATAIADGIVAFLKHQ